MAKDTIDTANDNTTQVRTDLAEQWRTICYPPHVHGPDDLKVGDEFFSVSLDAGVPSDVAGGEPAMRLRVLSNEVQGVRVEEDGVAIQSQASGAACVITEIDAFELRDALASHIVASSQWYGRYNKEGPLRWIARKSVEWQLKSPVMVGMYLGMATAALAYLVVAMLT